MPRSTLLTIQNNFTGGLITESTPLNFPQNACTDTLNCVFEYTGRVTRRQEIDLEDNYNIGSVLPTGISDAYTEFLWTQVALNGTFSFSVVQQGDKLHFYNIASNTTVSAEKNANVIDLSAFAAAETTLNVSEWPVDYAQGNGVLLVVSRAIDPIYISYNPGSDSFTVTDITLRFRDFAGLVDPYGDFTRPSFVDIPALKASGDGAIHYYNLLNQGWWQGTISGGELSATSALGQWDADVTAGSPAVGTMPSNCDQVSFYRASVTDAYDPQRLINYQQGNTLAIKGHFILEVGNVNRRQAVLDSGLTLNLASTGATFIPAASGTIIGGFGADGADAFDSALSPFTAADVATVSISAGAIGTGTYIGKDYTSLGGKKIFYIRMWAAKKSSTGPYGFCFDGTFNLTGYPVTLKIYAKNTLPVSKTDGTLLGTATFSSSTTQSNVLIESTDVTSTWNYVWVAIEKSTATGTSTYSFNVTEMDIFEATDNPTSGSFTEPDRTAERPQCVSYFAGRAWYGGINDLATSNLIYYSQIIESTDQYGKCYQQNDPTSEPFFDLLPSDGGVIKIPEMGQLIRLYAYQTALVCLASNGVWLIRGSSGSGFLATDYVVHKISSNGTQSPKTVVDVNGLPIWWGEEGILALQYNPQFDSFSVDIITDENIRSFYLGIPALQRAYAKGAYDRYLKYIYWVYQEQDTPRSVYDYNRALIYNTRTQAFFPWSFGVTTPIVRGIQFIEDTVGLADPFIKLPVTIPVDDTSSYLTYAAINHTVPRYTDWYKYANEVALNASLATDFNSYFVSGYEIDGQTQKFGQPNYVMFFLDQDGNEDQSSAYMQGIFDFSISGNSGKWSTRQQIYNSGTTYQNLNYRRLKVRGKGRAMQFKVTSEPGKPFSIVGWSVWKTVNSED